MVEAIGWASSIILILTIAKQVAKQWKAGTSEGVSIWFRGIFRFDLHPDLMADAPWSFQLHGLVAMALFALWPFTRLVHVFSAPLGYLTRPYIVYRSRDVQLGSHRPRRGWDRVG